MRTYLGAERSVAVDSLPAIRLVEYMLKAPVSS
jgi:hypothetical protein